MPTTSELREWKIMATNTPCDTEMSLDEAIEHADNAGDGDGACANDHRQLAAWLRELKRRRKNDADQG